MPASTQLTDAGRSSKFMTVEEGGGNHSAFDSEDTFSPYITLISSGFQSENLLWPRLKFDGRELKASIF